jgi:hypothetical protein
MKKIFFIASLSLFSLLTLSAQKVANKKVVLDGGKEVQATHKNSTHSTPQTNQQQVNETKSNPNKKNIRKNIGFTPVRANNKVKKD